MFTIQKLKPDRSITGLIPAIAALSGGAILGIFFGLEAAFRFIALFFWGYAIFSLATFARTRNTAFIIAVLYQFFGGVMIYTLPSINAGTPSTLNKFSGFCALFFLIWLVYLQATKKIKWRGREVLEKAAMPVDETANGYTPRPLPVGKTEFNRSQIMNFAEFARRNLMAATYVGKDKLVFVPVMMGREFAFILGLKSDYTDETWVSFDFEGNVSVNISHRDYLNYKEALSFEQLCESLGSLFIEFIEIHNRGEGVRIIDRMDALGIGIFS